MIDKMTASQGRLPKACWKTLGSVMNSRLGPASGWMPTEKAAGKIMKPARMATIVSIHPTLSAVLGRLVSLRK